MRELRGRRGGAATGETLVLVAFVGLLGIAGFVGLGTAFDGSIARTGDRVPAPVASVSRDFVSGSANAPTVSTSAQAGVVRWVRILAQRADALRRSSRAATTASLVTDADVLAHARTTKRFFPNTRIVLEAGVNGGAWPSFGTSVGFVRENDLAVGRNGVYGTASAGWLIGGMKKFRSHRPELSSPRGSVSKDIGLFSFGDPVRGLKTQLELPVPLAAWIPFGLVPGIGAAEHAGRPGMLLSLQVPVVLLPFVGDKFASVLHSVLPGADSGGTLTRLANVTSLRVAVNVGIYHPRLARYANFVNAGARYLAPHIRRATDAVGRVKDVVVSKAIEWRGRFASQARAGGQSRLGGGRR